MGGLFGVASKEDCVLELFYGVDYHSHLGTRRGGMATHGADGFNRAIHNIENSPFRTKFDRDVGEMKGNLGIGCISDFEPQPLLIQSHLGSFAITTVGKINNQEELLRQVYRDGHSHFQEMSSGQINATELVASLICKKPTIVEGIQYVQEIVDGSMTMLLMTKDGLYAARDRYGRTPLVIGHKEGAYCVSFESFAYINLGYQDYKELGPAEIAFITPEGVETLAGPGQEMKICSFLWVYYGYPTSSYEGVNVEEMRYKCGSMLARRDGDSVEPDIVAGVPDSGVAHAIGYSNEAGIPYARPFIKYTPTWHSIVRGTQLRETTEFLYQSGAKEVHVRPACPPLLYGCKYLNFSRSKSEMDLITRRMIREREGENCSQEVLEEYANPCSCRYAQMIEDIRKQQNFTTLRYHRLDDLIASIGIEPCKLCTYCFDGKE